MVTSVIRSLFVEGVGTSVADDTGNGNGLTFDPSAGDAAWTSIASGNGIDYTAAISTAGTAIVGLEDILNNGNIGSSFIAATQLSFLIVCDIDAGDNSGPRLVQAGTDGGDGDFAIGTRPSDWLFRWSKEVGGTDITYPVPTGGYPTGLMVIAVAIDTTLATAADRIKVWYNNVQQTAISGTIPQNESISLNNAAYNFSVGNRYTLNRNIDGQIYYTELFTGVLTDAEVSTATTNLLADNDSNWATVPVTGTVDTTLDPITSDASGLVIATGTIASTLDPITSDASGTVGGIVGTISSTLDPITSDSSGLLKNAGNINSTLDPITSDASGILLATGSIASTLDPITSNSTGQLSTSGTINTTLDPITSDADGSLVATGTITSTLDPITSNSAGTVGAAITGTIDTTLDPITSDSSGTVTIGGAINSTLDPITSTSSGILSIQGAVDSTLAPIDMDAAGLLSVVGVGDSTLDPITSTSAGVLTATGTVATTLDPITMDAAGFVSALAVTGTIDSTLDPIFMVASGSTGAEVTPIVRLTGSFDITTSLTGSTAGKTSLTGST